MMVGMGWREKERAYFQKRKGESGRAFIPLAPGWKLEALGWAVISTCAFTALVFRHVRPIFVWFGVLVSSSHETSSHLLVSESHVAVSPVGPTCQNQQ
jgi:hypothetical protein